LKCITPSKSRKSLSSSAVLREKREELKNYNSQLNSPFISRESELLALKGLVVEVEGNIGSGKSTLTGMMKNFVNSKLGDEHTCCFGEKVNNAFLKLFYSDPPRFSFAFQMYMLTTRLYQIDESFRQARKESKLCFLDRGAVGDTLFALLNYQLGSMKEDEMQCYRSVCRERLPASISDQVDMLIYLDVDPSECHRRMTSLRKRDSESGVPLSYLEEVDSCYFHLLMDWFGDRKGTFHEMNIGQAPRALVIRWDQFGEPDVVLNLMSSLLKGSRPNPKVSFHLEAPDGLTLLDTAADIAEAYNSLTTTGRISTRKFHDKVGCNLSPCESSSPISSPSPPLSLVSVIPVSKFVENSKTLAGVGLNWDVEHNNAFKRVTMYFLANSIPLSFYGRSTAVNSQSNGSKSE